EFNIPIIGGGIHATADPEGVMASGYFDFVCIGEGETALSDLVTRLEKGVDYTDIPNLWVNFNGKVIKNKVGPFIDLAKLPPKDYEIFDFQKMIDAKGGWVGVMASRGCPYRCTYCFNHQIVNIYKKDLQVTEGALNYIRYHPISEVIKELRYLVKTYRNIKTFIFDDDIFTLDKNYLREFCKSYRQEIGIPFVVNGHVKNFDLERANLLKESGCIIVKFGLESGSERIRREILRRYMSNQEIVRSFEAAHKAGLHTSAFVMFGFPYETKEDIMMTIKLLAQIKPGRFRWSIFFPYVNTDAYLIAQQGGFINEVKMNTLDNFFEESCLDFGPEMNFWIEKLQKVFPWYVNAGTDWPCASRYADLVRKVEELSPEEWEEKKEEFIRQDREISAQMVESRNIHFAIKYNPFMGVRSDYFLSEGVEEQ
ncbi:MAG: B12-binding domain-containing radical SAM protein, partial [Desulfobacterota bacterium]|nr:B12-binding domain-containing radical SAM protein [Thermodesulfobacteriota bacterium]